MSNESNSFDSRREAQDEVLVAALAAGRTYEEAGKLAGVSARTVSRRMSEVGFARMVADRRGEQVVAVAGRITALTSEALDVIAACLTDTAPSTRLTASKLVLEWALKLRRGEDLALAVAEIRQHVGLEDVR